MSVTKRIRKNGNVVYEIRIARGRDPITGKQLPPFTKTFSPPEGCPQAKALRLAQREEIVFESECKRRIMQPSDDKQLADSESQKQEQTIIDIFNEIFALMVDDVKRNTAETYRKMMKLFVDYAGSMSLSGIDKSYIRVYLSALGKQGYSDGTVRLSLFVLRRFFNLSTERGYFTVSPVKGVSVPKRKGVIEDTTVEIFTREELKRILDCVSQWPLVWQTLIQLLLETGCRIGEAEGLQWNDVDIAHGEIHIRHNLQRGETGVYMTSPKSNKNRALYLPPSSKALKLISELQSDAQYVQSSQFIFHTDTAQYLTRGLVEYRFRVLSKQSNVIGIHPHKFRHTMASMAIQAGVDIVTVSKLLGHASPSITASIYLHTDVEQKRNGMTKLGELLGEI